MKQDERDEPRKQDYPCEEEKKRNRTRPETEALDEIGRDRAELCRMDQIRLLIAEKDLISRKKRKGEKRRTGLSPPFATDPSRASSLSTSASPPPPTTKDKMSLSHSSRRGSNMPVVQASEASGGASLGGGTRRSLVAFGPLAYSDA